MLCSFFDPTVLFILAFSLPLALVLITGNCSIAWLQRRFRAPLKTDSATLARLQASKRATPTMGGLFILAAAATSVLLFADWNRGLTQLSLLVMAGFALIGAIDDLAKLRPGSPGLRAWPKFLAQLVVSALVAALLVHQRNKQLAIESCLPNLGLFGPWLLTAWATLVIISSSNAVNLADGLDGLAGGVASIAIVCLTAVAWFTADSSTQMLPFYVLAGGMLGSVLGFLRFNRHPARVFMGDTGSLPLGALLGFMALAIGQELLWILIGGVFVAEAASVILQVGWFKWRNERLFRCAPLHHHFQFLGWTEQKIVRRFWLASLILAAAAVVLVQLPKMTSQSTAGDASALLTSTDDAR